MQNKRTKNTTNTLLEYFEEQQARETSKHIDGHERMDRDEHRRLRKAARRRTKRHRR